MDPSGQGQTVPEQPRGGVTRRALPRFGQAWTTVLAVTAIFVVPLRLLIAYLERERLSFMFDTSPTFDTSSDAAAELMAGPVLAARVLSMADALFLGPVLIGVALLVCTRTEDSRDVLLGRAVRLWPRLAGVMLLGAILSALPLLPGGVLLTVSIVDGLDGTYPNAPMLLLGGVLFLAGVVPSLYISLGLTLATPVVVAERARVREALRASWRRMRGSRLAALRGYLGMGLLVIVPMMFVAVVADVLARAIGPAAWSLTGVVTAMLEILGPVALAAVAAVLLDDTRPAEPDMGLAAEGFGETPS